MCIYMYVAINLLQSYWSQVHTYVCSYICTVYLFFPDLIHLSCNTLLQRDSVCTYIEATWLHVYIFQTRPNGLDRTEGMKFGPDQTRYLNLMHIFSYDLQKFRHLMNLQIDADTRTGTVKNFLLKSG